VASLPARLSRARRTPTASSARTSRSAKSVVWWRWRWLQRGQPDDAYRCFGADWMTDLKTTLSMLRRASINFTRTEGDDYTD
jgi:hypothetical protein